MRDIIFKLRPIYAVVIYQIPYIRWFQWIPVPFRENSIELKLEYSAVVEGIYTKVFTLPHESPKHSFMFPDILK